MKKISNYGCYGYNRLKRTSVATIAPPIVNSKHNNSFSFTSTGSPGTEGTYLYV